MKNYLDLLRLVIETGTRQSNRTGVDTLFIPGAMLQFDLAQGFPIVTTKKVAWESCKGEMLAFLRGCSSAAEFRALGCKWWDANANENQQWLSSPYRTGEDDLGRIYGVQWRRWRMIDDKDGLIVGHLDQVMKALHDIKHNPTSRRIIISAWRPDELDEMALPPCHVLYQFLVNVERKELNLCMYQRSCDLFLGVPMNISGAALMLTIFADLTGLRPRHFTHFLADAHVYVNHLDQVREQLSREPYCPPSLGKSLRMLNWEFDFEPQRIDQIEPSDYMLAGYTHHPAITAPLAV